MEGVTTAIVGFIFVCVVFPHLVKQKAQFYAALAAVVLILLAQAFGLMIHSEGFSRVVGFVTLLLQVAGILLLFLSCGGLSARELAGEMRDAIEVIRRGGEKEIIIPLTGDEPRPRRNSRANDPDATVARANLRKPADEGGIPLE